MRLLRRPAIYLLLLLSSSSSVQSIRTSDQVAALAEGKSDPLGPSPNSPIDILKADPDSNAGRKDAPVDGKDGRPHQGPFVETNAERDRKKAKESGDEEAAKKPPPKDKTKEASYQDGWELPMTKLPITNDGVMDDPNRTGPKEGTRGTEGGISEKSGVVKGKEGDSATGKSEKKPDPPKEAPPLPHGEQEKLGSKDNKDPTKKTGDVVVEEAEKQKELGGLEVRSSSLPVV